jgi:hypothetical protein
MGMYDIYGEEGAQLKVGPCDLKHYLIGEVVSIEDGVYVAPYEGIVVVYKGILVAVVKKMWSKWGHVIDWTAIVEEMNPLMEYIKQFKVKESEDEDV